MATLVKSLWVKGFGIVNDRTDTYLTLNVQSCGLQLEPCLDFMASETVCLVMQTLYKSTLNKAFIIRQIVVSEFAATSEYVIWPVNHSSSSANCERTSAGCLRRNLTYSWASVQSSEMLSSYRQRQRCICLHAKQAQSSQGDEEHCFRMQDHNRKKRKAANVSLAVSSAENEQPSALKRLQAVAAGAEKLWQEAVSARTPVSSLP